MRDVRKILNVILQAGGVGFNGADENDIDQMSNTLIAANLSPIPEELGEFLKINDGFYHNAFELYGCREHRSDKELFSLPDIMQVTSNLKDHPLAQGKLLVATYHSEVLFYEQNILKMASRLSLVPFREFASLSDAICQLLKIDI